jgi:hypothetical protein
MRKLLMLVLLLMCAVPGFAQVDTAWVRSSGGTSYALAVDDSGNVYVTAESASSGTGSDYATIKYYPNGDTAWVRRYNGPADGQDQPSAIAVDDSGNVYVTGFSLGIGTHWDWDYATIKYYANGDTAWVRRYDGPGNSSDAAVDIAVDDSGNVYVTGTTYDADWDYWADWVTIKYYSNGNTAWVRIYNGSDNANDWARALAVDTAGCVYVTGSRESFSSRGDYATVKYYANGDIAWVRTYDGPASFYDDAYAVAVDGSGNVYVTGGSDAGGSDDDDYATIKYYPNGDTAWVRRYNGGPGSMDIAYAIAVDDSGNVCVTGTGGTYEDYLTIKYDANGDTAWVRRYSGPGHYFDYASSVAVDHSGNVYVTGYIHADADYSDYATIKYYPNGDIGWVARYNGTDNGDDRAFAVAVGDSENVYVTGKSVTIKYVQREWTILVYMNGDNDLEASAIDDINEMEMVDSSALVSIVVQVDRIPGYDNSNGNWTDTRRYYITNDSDPNTINSIRLDTLPPLGELNMGDPQTLVDFVNWGISNYPAAHYAVVVWDHGNGWYKKPFGEGLYEDDILLKGMSFDDTDSANIGVSDGEWESAISTIRDSLGRKIDLVGFDACLMQMWEVMDITDEYADYMVGPEQTENGDGWCYDQFLSALVANPTMSSEELGMEIVDAAVDGDNQNTQSCVGLAQVPTLTTAVDNFANELLVAIEDTANETIINNIRTQLTTLGHEFYYSSHIDLYDFSNMINNETTLPSNLRTAAFDVMSAITNAVTWNRTKPAYTWANGIAVYYPADPSDYDERYDNLPVASNTLWDDFIRRFTRGDANGDGVINGADIAYLINYLFVGGPVPQPWEAGDVNCDGFINGADVAYLINYLFIGGPAPCR